MPGPTVVIQSDFTFVFVRKTLLVYCSVDKDVRLDLVTLPGGQAERSGCACQVRGTGLYGDVRLSGPTRLIGII